MSDKLRDELGRILYGVDYDADEARDSPEIFQARMEGRRLANRRWNRWLQKQGYSVMEACAIIGMEAEE